MGRSFEEDPLTMAMRPPADETPEQQLAREQREADARRVSEAIDEQIGKEKRALAKKKKPVKVLLLGQAESGACHRASTAAFALISNVSNRIQASRRR